MVQLVDRNKFFLTKKEISTILTNFPKKLTYKNVLHVKVAFSIFSTPSNLTQEFHLMRGPQMLI